MHNMKKNYLVFILFLSVFATHRANAQEGRLPTKQELAIKENLRISYMTNRGIPGNYHLLATGPEQDCDNAIPICTNTFHQGTSYTGPGTSQEVTGTCLSSQETNSVWYVFTVQNSGTFVFNLVTTNDYDFALYDITTIGCSGVPSATPVRCNYSATFGNTGLTLPTSATNPLSVDASGVPTMPGVNVTAGQTFVLIVDNYSANTNGYDLTFGGSATIFDVTPPTITSHSVPCNGNTFQLNFSEPISCSSLQANGSDFTITGPSGSVPVISTIGALCSSGASNANSATVTFNNAGMTTGTYTVLVAIGTDTNSLVDKCGNSMSITETFTFPYIAPITGVASPSLVCVGLPSTLTVNGAGAVAGVTYS